MKKLNFQLATLCLLAFAALALLNTGGAVQGGKGGNGNGNGGGSGDPPPTIEFAITFLGAPEISSSDIQAFGFNNFCDVVGKFHDGFRYVAYIDTEEIGMVSVESLIDPNGVYYVGVGEPGTSGWALDSADAINDFGQIVGRGWFVDADGSWSGWQGYRANPPGSGETYWTIEALGDVVPLAINNSGDVTGPIYEEDGIHGFLYTDDAGLQDLGTLPSGHNAWPETIADRDVDGVIRLAGGFNSPRAFRYTTGVGYEDLGTLRSDNSGNSRAMGMNDDGDVVGWADADRKKGNDNSFAFLYSDAGGMVSLGTLSSERTWNDSRAFGVNRHGEVLGESMTEHPEWRAFYWTSETGMLKLEDLITNLPNDVTGLGTVGHINDLGEMCGVFPGNSTRPRQIFILTPVP